MIEHWVGFHDEAPDVKSQTRAILPDVQVTELSVRYRYTTLRNFRQHNAFEQRELILQAALDPAIANRARRGEFVACFDHFDLLQTAIN